MKTEIVKTIEAITEYLNDLGDHELIELHNEYCRENSYEDEIYGNDEDFFQTFFTNNVIRAVQAVSYGSYNYTDKYVQFNGQGNLSSSNSAGQDYFNKRKVEAILLRAGGFTLVCTSVPFF